MQRGYYDKGISPEDFEETFFNFWMMDLHLSLLILLLSLCQVGGMLYFERNSGMIVCEDIFDEIPECDATTKQTTECVTTISVIDCSTAQDTTSECEELTEDPTECDPPKIPTTASVQPTNVSKRPDHTSTFSSVTHTDKTLDSDNTTSRTISQTIFTASPTTSELTGIKTTVAQHTPITLSNSDTTTIPDTSSSYTGKTTVIDSQTTIRHVTPATANNGYTTIVMYTSDSHTGKTTIDNSWTTFSYLSDTTTILHTQNSQTEKTTILDSRTPQHLSGTTVVTETPRNPTGKTTIYDSHTTPQHLSDTTVVKHTPSSATRITTIGGSWTTPQHLNNTSVERRTPRSPTMKTTINNSWTTFSYLRDTTTILHTQNSQTEKTTILDSRTPQHLSGTTVVTETPRNPTGKTTIYDSHTTPQHLSDTTVVKHTPSSATRITTIGGSWTTPQHLSGTTVVTETPRNPTGKTTIYDSHTTPQHLSDTTVVKHTPSSATRITTIGGSWTTPQHLNNTTIERHTPRSPTMKTTINNSWTTPKHLSDTTVVVETPSSPTGKTTIDDNHTTPQHLSDTTIVPDTPNSPTGKTTTDDSLTTTGLLNDATSVRNNTKIPTSKTTIENSQTTPELNSTLSTVSHITHKTVKNTDATEVVRTKNNHTTERTITGNETIQLTGLTTISTNQTLGITQDNVTSKENTDPTSSSKVNTEEPCDERICPCPTHFYGKNCRFIYNEIILDFVVAKVEISIHVLNEEFNSSLNNPLSSEYQDFHDRFLNEMEFNYKSALPRFKEIRIVSFRQGSVIVDHEVLVKVDYGKYLEETQQAESQLRATLTQLNCSSNRTGRLCFNVTKTTIKRKYIKDSDLCLEEETIPQDMQHYFHGLNMSGRLLCVTECSVKHHSPIDCNWGQCLLVRDTGPNCYCDTSDQFWYTGDRCQTPVSKPGVYGGVTVGLIVLIVIIVILVIALCRRRYQSEKDLLVDTEPQCHNFGWTRHYKVHGRLVNPETDKMMFGPRGTFKLTMENVNPGAQEELSEGRWQWGKFSRRPRLQGVDPNQGLSAVSGTVGARDERMDSRVSSPASRAVAQWLELQSLHMEFPV
ncbi:uncharacterized protein [Phyllobates terribilis]|uniref:uncharacterized protein isoform X2 n=1 Tax=Phyllobates terribilis TaxID=111132 RepID=UPI003CCB2D56